MNTEKAIKEGFEMVGQLAPEGAEELEKVTDHFFKTRFSLNRLNFEKGYSYYFEWAERIYHGRGYIMGDLETQKVLTEMEKSGMLDNFRQTGLNRKW